LRLGFLISNLGTQTNSATLVLPTLGSRAPIAVPPLAVALVRANPCRFDVV
jgi:hypothetical protein